MIIHATPFSHDHPIYSSVSGARALLKPIVGLASYAIFRPRYLRYLGTCTRSGCMSHRQRISFWLTSAAIRETVPLESSLYGSHSASYTNLTRGMTHANPCSETVPRPLYILTCAFISAVMMSNSASSSSVTTTGPKP